MRLPTGTAVAHATDTLNAPVMIFSEHTHDGIRYADVETVEGGTGGWATPGKRLTVKWDILRDYQPVTPLDIVDALSDTAAKMIETNRPDATTAQAQELHRVLFSHLFRKFLSKLDAVDPAAGTEFRAEYLRQYIAATSE